MATLAERLQAEIDRSNVATGKTDTTVHDAVGSLIDGYGQGQSGPTGRVIYSDYDENGLPHTLEYVPASPTDTKLPDRFLSYGHSYTIIGWHSQIEKIICPNHITELGIGGFGVGTKSKEITNYDYIEVLGESALKGDICHVIYDYLPPNLRYIGNNALSRAPLISGARFQFPDSVAYIGDHAFAYYSYNRENNPIYLPLNLEYIGANAFYNNGFQLFPVDEIVIPAKVHTIRNDAFGGGAYETEKITFLGKPSSISESAFKTTTSKGSMKALVEINVPWSEGEVANAPWGAVNATINYNYVRGDDV